MNALELLKETRDLLSDPNKWARGESALNVDGLSTLPTSNDAYKFCLTGAMYKIAREQYFSLYKEIRDQLYEIIKINPVTWNDRVVTSHTEFMQVLDQVIEKMEKENV